MFKILSFTNLSNEDVLKRTVCMHIEPTNENWYLEHLNELIKSKGFEPIHGYINYWLECIVNNDFVNIETINLIISNYTSSKLSLMNSTTKKIMHLPIIKIKLMGDDFKEAASMLLEIIDFTKTNNLKSISTLVSNVLDNINQDNFLKNLEFKERGSNS